MRTNGSSGTDNVAPTLSNILYRHFINWFGIITISAGVGFLSGLFGKGGSAIATPLLHLAGVPALIAVASPLPAVLPSTLVAAFPYWRQGFVNWRLVKWGALFGIPSTIAGALLTRWITGNVLIGITDALIVCIAVRLLITHGRPDPPHNGHVSMTLIATVAVAVGFLSGLLANSGGFLLAPLFIVVLGLSVRQAFASSLILSAAFALPGTAIHAYLGHIDWTVTLVFALGSVPLAAVGSRVALRTKPARLEIMYSALLLLVSAISIIQLATFA